MEQLEEFDPTKSVKGSSQTVRWTPDDAYTQAHGNNPEYAGHVRGVNKNILLVRGYIHFYYTPSQVRSQNTPPLVVISEIIKKSLEVKEEQHKQEMGERLAQQREEMEGRVAQQMGAMSAVLTERFAAHMAAYEARFRSLEGSTVVSSDPEVTTKGVVHDLGSLARRIIRSSANSTQGNNQVILLSFNKRIIYIK
jgi:hypothetical protein